MSTTTSSMNAITTYGVTLANGSLNAILSSASLPFSPLSSAGPSPAATMRRNLISVTIIMIQLIAAAIVAIDIR